VIRLAWSKATSSRRHALQSNHFEAYLGDVLSRIQAIPTRRIVAPPIIFGKVIGLVIFAVRKTTTERTRRDETDPKLAHPQSEYSIWSAAMG
jgi:hypothetical protein